MQTKSETQQNKVNSYYSLVILFLENEGCSDVVDGSPGQPRCRDM